MTARSSMLTLMMLCIAGSGVLARAQSQTPTPLLFNPASPQSMPDHESLQTDTKWVQTVREDLVAERFDTLEAMAAEYRTKQTRAPGGDWQLAIFYGALSKPHAGDIDTPDHLLHLQHWMAAKPQSVTAAVAYASSMRRWAWQARTNAAAEKVTDEGWRLFSERMALGRAALDKVGHAESPKGVADPQWYCEYMTAALAQDWNNERMQALYGKASAAAPGYFYIQKQYANYLLPKWEGRPGDAAAFAKNAADALGGSDGDVLYWEIGTVLLSCGNPSFHAKTLEWPRLQRGHAALVEKYGSTRRVENEYALMAYRERDAMIAQQQFAAIGDHWSRTVWRDRDYFDKARDWSAAVQSGTVPSAAKGLLPLGPQ